jgi:hypothetical protein
MFPGLWPKAATDDTLITPPRRRGTHRGERGASQSHGRHHVQAVHAILPFERGLPKAALSAESGVVDQQFEAGFGCDTRFDLGQIAFQSQVGRHDLRAGQSAGQPLELFAPPRHQNEGEAIARQTTREDFSNSTGGSGHQGYPPRVHTGFSVLPAREWPWAGGMPARSARTRPPATGGRTTRCC